VSNAFNLFISEKLTYDQAKVSCSEGILRNLVLLAQKYELTREHIQELNNYIEVKVVPYLQRKYPLTESLNIYKSLDSVVKIIDKSDNTHNDLLFKSGVVFTFRKDGNYNRKIMEFINWIIQQPE